MQTIDIYTVAHAHVVVYLKLLEGPTCRNNTTVQIKDPGDPVVISEDRGKQPALDPIGTCSANFFLRCCSCHEKTCRN